MTTAEQDPGMYALRDSVVLAAGEMLIRWESSDLVSTYLAILLTKPERRELAAELIREIDRILEHDGSEEWVTAKKKLETMLERRDRAVARPQVAQDSDPGPPEG